MDFTFTHSDLVTSEFKSC